MPFQEIIVIDLVYNVEISMTFKNNDIKLELLHITFYLSIP